jgi:cysteine desulfurase
MIKRVYLDYAAATPVDPRVKEAMDNFCVQGFANPSGLHEEGLFVKRAMESARKTIADFIRAKFPEIVFTSSATESNNLAILGVARANKEFGKHLITTSAEHASVLNVFKQLEKEGFKVTYLLVDEYGMVSADQINSAIRPDTILVSVIFASNEIGTINPIGHIGQIVKKSKNKNGFPYFHTDAAQAIPHIKINVEDLGIDLMSFSASKIYGPKGAAALYIKHGTNISPIIFGGSQENGIRAGTQDVCGIVGFAKAVEIIKSEYIEDDRRIQILRDKIIKEIKSAFPEVLLNGPPTPATCVGATEGRSPTEERLANNINVSIPGISGEKIVVAMDMAGFSLSTRSACDATNSAPPHVIKSLGRTDEEAWGAVRITLGRYTTEENVDKFIKAFFERVKSIADKKL